MLDNYGLNELETLKSILTFTGTGASLLFGIIGTTFKTHRDVTVPINGKQTTESRPTGWLWVAIIGLIVGSLITSTSVLLDSKISDIKNEIAGHPFFPFQLQAVVKFKATEQLKNDARFAQTKEYLRTNAGTIKVPPDFTIKSTSFGTQLFFGGNYPFNPLDTLPYDSVVRVLNERIFNAFLPPFEFCIYESKPDTLNSKFALYNFSSGNSISDRNLISEPLANPNCKLSYSIDYDNTVTIVYSAPLNYWETNASFSSLYAVRRNGLVTFALRKNPITGYAFSLDYVLLYCGSRSELVPVKLTKDDIVEETKERVVYAKPMKEILKPDAKIRY